jgi:V8-like Glu-specific endopeptidase
MMIDSAVAVATGRSRPRKTQEIAAMVDQRVHAATAGHRRTSYLLGGLIVVALGTLAVLILYGRKSGDEIEKLRAELNQLPPDDPRRKQIESRLGTLHPSNANFGRNLYDRSKKGVFMLAGRQGGFCTAFAVRPDKLATNAHCVIAARNMGGSIVAVENEGRGQVSFPVSDMRQHPSYRDRDETALTPDVGVVTISGRAAVVLEMASTAELQVAGAGDDIYLIGFPGRLMDAQNAAATFMAANIGRITTASGRPGSFAEAWLVQHDAATTSGTSGSPIFNGKGKVIAVNTGGYLEKDDETIAGKKAEVVKASPYKFGMRIDLVDVLLR